MNVQSAFSSIRFQLNETTAAFWTDTEIYGYMSEGELELSYRTGGIKAATTHTTVTDTSVYALPADVLRINRVTYDGKKLKKVDDTDIDWLDGTTYGSTVAAGSPEVYREFNDEITLYETPDDAKPLIFEIIKSPTVIGTASTQFTLVNDAIHKNVIPYTLWKAYTKANELNQADRYKAEFEEGAARAISTQRDQEDWDRIAYVKDEDQYPGGNLGMD